MTKRTSILGAVTIVAMVAGAPRVASAKQFKYVGMHPIKKGVFCHIEAPHVHAYAPVQPKVLYRVHDGHYYFVGDPEPYDYDGPTHSYYGHHPVNVEATVAYGTPDHVEYCYLDGPHYHYYAPPPGLAFEVKGGVNWYVGAYPETYVEAKPRLVRINKIYADAEYTRPVVEVEPPVAYVGPVVEVHAGPPGHAHGHVHGGVGISAGVEVHVPVPAVEVQVGVPGVVVVDDHHHHVKHRHYKHRKYKQRGHKRGKWKRKGWH